MRELLTTGWLAKADLDLPGRDGETPMACLQRKLRDKPADINVAQMIELLHAERQLQDRLKAAAAADDSHAQPEAAIAAS